MLEEAVSALLVGLFGICSGDAFSWNQQSLLPPFLDVNPSVYYHPTCCQIYTPFLFQSLIRLLTVALDFTSWPPQQVSVTGSRSGSPASAAHRAAPASAAHRAALASAAHRAASIGGLRTAPHSVAIDGGGASAAFDFDYWDPGPGFSYCWTTVMVVLFVLLDNRNGCPHG